MALYRYKALTEYGKISRGYVLGSTRNLALQILYQRKLEPIRLVYSWSVWQKVNLGKNRREALRFFVYLAYAVESGKRIPQALLEMHSSFSGTFRDIVSTVHQDLLRGVLLSEACHAYPQIFDSVVLALLQLGERSGQFLHICQKAQSYIRNQVVQRDQTLKALGYPMFSLGTFCVAFWVITHSVLPELLDLLDEQKIPLSCVTHVLRILCQGSFGGLPMGILVGALGAALGYALFYPYSKRWIMESSFRYLPGKQWRADTHYERFFSALYLLCQADMSLMASLPVAASVPSSSYLRSFLFKVHPRIQSGEHLYEALQDAPLLRDFFLQLLHSGEKNGKLMESLWQVIQILQYELSHRMEKTLTWAPTLILCVVSGFFVLLIQGVFMPLYGNIGNLYD